MMYILRPPRRSVTIISKQNLNFYQSLHDIRFFNFKMILLT